MDVKFDIGRLGRRLHREKKDRIQRIVLLCRVSEELLVPLAIVVEQSAHRAGAGTILQRERGASLKSEWQCFNRLERMDYFSIVGDTPQPVKPRDVGASRRLLTYTQHKVWGTLSTHDSDLVKIYIYIILHEKRKKLTEYN